MWRLAFLVLLWVWYAGAAGAETRTPSYIAAKPDDMLRAYGAEIANRVFSDEFTGARRQGIAQSLQDVPGLTCPKDAPVSLYDIYPFGDLRRPIWIERYSVGCERTVRRGLLFALDGNQVSWGLLAPGESAADPQLFADTLVVAETQALQADAGDSCKSARLVDTVVTATPRGGPPWSERWSFVACGKLVEVDVNYSVAADGGTDIRASAAKP